MGERKNPPSDEATAKATDSAKETESTTTAADATPADSEPKSATTSVDMETRGRAQRF